MITLEERKKTFELQKAVSKGSRGKEAEQDGDLLEADQGRRIAGLALDFFVINVYH